MGGVLAVFFLRSFSCTRYRVWKKFFAAVVMLLLPIVVGGSRPAQRLLPGAAGKCGEEVEEIKVATERVVQPRS